MSAVTTWTTSEKAKAWISLTRPPFHTVVLIPFTLGFIIAWHVTGTFDWTLWGWGICAAALILISTHMSGECYDYDEDVISGILGRSKFAGGTGVLQTGIISRRQSFKASVAALISAGFIGLLLRYHYNTGPWTIPLGMIGMIGGFLYSTPPIRWAKTGIGELWIGLCFGFLPPVIGFYLPAGYFEPILFIIAIPIAATIFNVILANEYPDYIADRQTGKRNLLIRVGKEKGARIYVTASVIGWAGAIGSVLYGVPKVFILFYFVPFGLSVFLVREFLKGSWKDANRLELMCGLGILTNATTSLSFCLAYIVG